MSLFDGARASEQKEVRKRGVDYAPFDGARASEPGVCADAGRTPGFGLSVSLGGSPSSHCVPQQGGRQNSTVRGHVCCVRRGSCLVRQIRRRPPVATDPRRSGVLQHVLFGFPRRAAECVRSSTSSTRTGSVPSWIRCPWCSRPPAWCMDGVLGSRMP